MRHKSGTISPCNTTNREDSLPVKSKTNNYNQHPNNQILTHGIQSDNTISLRHRPLSQWTRSKIQSSMNSTDNQTVQVQRSATPQYHNVPSIRDNIGIVRRQQHLEIATNNSRMKRNYKSHHYTNQNHKSQTNDWFGDKLIQNKGWETGEYTDTIRICSINVNGIAQDLDWIEWDMTLQNMYSQQIDVLGITEPNVNFKNMHVKSKLYDIARGFERNTQFSTSCSNQLRTTKKKQGGTMTILSGRWAGRKKKTANDPYGRWSSITLVGKKEREVTIITAYRVCQQKGGEGCTVYHQQQLDFEQKGQRRNSP
jgi:biopolymer transport protein ExbD